MSRQHSIGGIPAPIPDNEEARLEALHCYDVLEAPRGTHLNHITQAAARLFRVPIAMVTLVDRDRQRFKALVGYDRTETDREISFCAHAILKDQPLVVPDTHADPRFRQNALVRGEPFIRFYAGAPLVSPDGFRLGTLCVIDRKARNDLGEEEIELLKGLAALVVDAFELRSVSYALTRQRDELEKTQYLLDMALSASLTGVWRWKGEEDEIELHPTATRLLDLPAGQDTITLGELKTHVLPDDRARLINAFEEAGKCRGTVTCEVRIEDRNGNQRWLEISAERHPGNGAARPYFVGTIHDVTLQRQTVQGIEHLERLAAVGTLAAGVGHELNNPLTFVHTGIDFAAQTIAQHKRELSKLSAETYEDLQDVHQGLLEAREGAERIRDIVAELRRFGQPTTDHLEPTNVIDALEFALRMATDPIQSKARVIRDFQEIPPVDATKTLLSQVFINLLINAAQSIEPGQPSEQRITVRARGGRARICVEISDTGRGITPEILPRVFDPFYTTKGPHEGIGLGLSTALRIIRYLDGELDIHSAPGQGTTVRMTLPVSKFETPPMPNMTSPPSTDNPLENRPRLLFVDDEPRIGEAFRRLTRRHYETVTTTRADEALQWVDEGQRFDVIFSDLFMPDMTGSEFYEELRARAPDLARRVVFMTGGAFTEKARRLIAEENIPHLYKPFDLARLEEVVSEVVKTH